MRFSGLENAEDLHLLVRYGWITVGQPGRFSETQIYLHPLIRDVIRNLPLTDENLQGVKRTLSTLYLDVQSASRIEEINVDPKVLSPELAEMLSQIDPQGMVTDHSKLLHSVRMS